MATPPSIPHVLLAADGTAINRLLLAPDSDWQPPGGHRVVPDPDGTLWAAATTTTTAEEEPIPEPPPAPDWERFKRELLSSAALNAALAAAVTSAPAAVLALPSALLLAASGGDSSDFRAAWLQLRRQQLLPQPLLDQLTTLAQHCHLPAPLLRSIGGQR